MYDHTLLVETAAEFTGRLLSSYAVDEVLGDLAARLTRLLEVTGCGVSLGRGDAIMAVTAVPPAVMELEKYQETHNEGPCRSAYESGVLVAVGDLSHEVRWPGYRQVAAEVGIHAVAALPLRLQSAAKTVGALNLYHEEARPWTVEDLDAAQMLANMATAYLINASDHHKQVELSEQLQHALDNRVIIEQAKGMLAESNQISPEAAFEMLRQHARSNNLKLSDVAAAIVHTRLRL
ncbi:GAF and ANTAR domain-containing protein [Ruania albidiflava]|uniref:GAF and ANTAR domain-containing protein n=1 Tax=Ruania albidiflava TaxID=366586 RepID=UPI0023F3E8AD|nr:GAF and ANTAR domain-containing protein [Ruania albidiflava]